MARGFLIAILAGLGALGAPAAASEPAPPVDSFSVAYDIHIGGLAAGELAVEATIREDGYRARARMRTSGIAGFFLDENWRAVTEGEVRDGRLSPVRYSSDQQGERGERSRDVGYAGDDPVSVRSRPEVEARPWSVDMADQKGTVDPVTALVSLLAPAPEGAVCDRRILAYDGKHRFAFELEPARRRGDRLRCDGAYLRIGGYEPAALAGDDGRQPFTLFLKERDDGLWQVERVQADTAFGAGVMKLRE